MSDFKDLTTTPQNEARLRCRDTVEGLVLGEADGVFRNDDGLVGRSIEDDGLSVLAEEIEVFAVGDRGGPSGGRKPFLPQWFSVFETLGLEHSGAVDQIDRSTINDGGSKARGRKSGPPRDMGFADVALSIHTDGQ